MPTAQHNTAQHKLSSTVSVLLRVPPFTSMFYSSPRLLIHRVTWTSPFIYTRYSSRLDADLVCLHWSISYLGSKKGFCSAQLPVYLWEHGGLLVHSRTRHCRLKGRFSACLFRSSLPFVSSIRLFLTLSFLSPVFHCQDARRYHLRLYHGLRLPGCRREHSRPPIMRWGLCPR